MKDTYNTNREVSIQDETKWTTVIKPRTSLLDIRLDEIWKYRDLLFLFVRRDFVAKYKQTIFGPLWYLIEPVLTTVVFTVVFGNIAKISTDGLPQMLFYMAGVTSWNYFAECWKTTSDVFKKNENIFGKVYFPRIVLPLSIIISNLIKFGIQLLIFIGFYLYFVIDGAEVAPTFQLIYFPFLVMLMAGLGLGFGMIISSLTTKYRDLTFLVSFAVSLMMYATPVIYPLSTIPEKYKLIIMANPMTGVIEAFRFTTLGVGQFDWGLLTYSLGFMLVVMVSGVIIFNRTEKNFMDII